jgi:hypothetical protein
MNWINVKDQTLPKDESTFLALWKGQFCLASWDSEIQRFWLQMLPGQMSGDMKVDPEREGKFTHWCKLEYPEDY